MCRVLARLDSAEGFDGVAEVTEVGVVWRSGGLRGCQVAGCLFRKPQLSGHHLKGCVRRAFCDPIVADVERVFAAPQSAHQPPHMRVIRSLL